MKAAVYYGRNDVRLEDMPVPEIGENEVLVEMKACGICGSDLMDWYLKPRAPLVLGHEPAGIIAKKGSKVSNFDIGDRVFVHHHVACLSCHYCRHSDYTLCEQFHETNIKPGGFAQRFRVPAPNLQLDTMKIPSALSLEEATLIEPVGCCLRALKKCNVQTGDSVAVIGAGATGIIHVALSKMLGAKTIVSDLIDFRVKAAKRFGADVVVDASSEDVESVVKAETNGMGVDVAVVTAPSLEAYETGLRICRRGGKLCIFAPTKPGEYFQVGLKELLFAEVQIIPSYSTSHLETKEALELLQSGRLNLKDILTHRFKLADVGKAFKTALESKDSLKVIVVDK